MNININKLLKSYHLSSFVGAEIIKSFISKRKVLKYKVTGILEINTKKNYGFIRMLEAGFKPTPIDTFISQFHINNNKLSNLDYVTCYVTIKNKKVSTIKFTNIVKPNNFYNKTAVHPNKMINLNENTTCKILSFLAPMGYGQRTIVSAPPKSGKTHLLKNILNSLVSNHNPSDIYIILCGERIEEVTEFQLLDYKINIIATTFDDNPDLQIKTISFVMEYIKVQASSNGRNCIVLLDSLSRVVRAYNSLSSNNNGKTLSGGVDYEALLFGKKVLGAARNLMNGGSITMIATTLVETNSRADEVTFEELKGTSNCDINLSRKIAESSTFPAIDCKKTSTRNPNLLFDTEQEYQIYQNIKQKVIQMDLDCISFLKGVIEGEKTENNKCLISLLINKI